MKSVDRLPLLQVVLLLSVACCARARPNPSQNDFTSVFEDADPAISDFAADQLAADVEVLVSILARGPRRMLLAAAVTHTSNATSHHSKSPQPSAVPLSPMPTEGDPSAVLPACKNITEMTPACSAALQAQQSRTVMIVVIVCAVGTFLVIGVIAHLVWTCIRSNQELPPQTRGKDPTGPAIKSGDPTRMAAAILQRHHELAQTLSLPLGFMKWDNIAQFGAATAGPCVMMVHYCPVLRHEAADNLRWLIRDLRDLGQLGVPEAAPFGHNRTVYGALTGLQLSMDAEDIRVLLQKCTQDGLAVHLPSGCWLEGTRDAALAPNKGMPPRDRVIEYRV